MQGVFNVDWPEALDPYPDEEAQRESRKQDREEGATEVKTRGKAKPKNKSNPDAGQDPGLGPLQPIQEVDEIRARAGSDSSGDDDESEDEEDPEDEDDQLPKGLQAATPSFRLKDQLYYVIPGRHPSRPGKFGHYIRPYRIDRKTHLCIPGRKQARLRDPLDKLFAGMPGVPWPPKDICSIDYKHYHSWSRYKRELKNVNEEWYNRMEDIIDIMEDGFLTGVPGLDIDDFKQNWNDLYKLGPVDEKDPYLPPDPKYMAEDINFVTCPDPTQDPAYYEIGRDYLSSKCEVIHMLLACTLLVKPN
jgi:hypothetical protein